MKKPSKKPKVDTKKAKMEAARGRAMWGGG